MVPSNQSQQENPEAEAYHVEVEVAGRSGVRQGYVVYMTPQKGFIALDSCFSEGDEVDVDVLSQKSTTMGIRLKARISDIDVKPTDDADTMGIYLEWQEAMGQESEHGLTRFLTEMMGVDAPMIRKNGELPFAFRYTFAAQDVVQPRVRPSIGMGRSEPSSALKSRFGRPKRHQVSMEHRDGAAHHEKPNAPIDTPPPSAQAPPRNAYVAPPSADPTATATQGELLNKRLTEIKTEAGGEAREASNGVFSMGSSSPNADGQGGQGYGGAQAFAAGPGAGPAGSNYSGVERRDRPRVTMAVPITFFLRSRPALGIGMDVSRGGMFIQTDVDIPKVDTRLIIRLPIMHGGRYQVAVITARIVRQKTAQEKTGITQGFATKFMSVDEVGVTGLFGYFLKSKGMAAGEG